MTDFRNLAESTSETVRDLVSQVIIKHELAALEIMHELKAENVKLRAAVEQARAALTKITTTYDAYRRRGVAPAPVEYADLVDAIEANTSRDALRALDEALK